MRGLEVFVAWSGFVDFDDDEADEEGADAEQVEEEVGKGASAFLGGRVGWLEDEGGLGYEEEAGLERISLLLDGVECCIWR